MKKALIIILVISILMGNSGIMPAYAAITNGRRRINIHADIIRSEESLSYTGLNDPRLHQTICDNIYAELESSLESDDLIIEDISTVYLSKEYIEEFAYNSRRNIFFGYTLAELDEQFTGERYVFTLGEDGSTTVKIYESVGDDVFSQVIKNIAIGAGVILICITVSRVTSNGILKPISMIFAESAHDAGVLAGKSAAVGGFYQGITKWMETGDIWEAIEAGALTATEEFRAGALIGTKKTLEKRINIQPDNPGPAKATPSPDESENHIQEILGGKKDLKFPEGKEVDRTTQGVSRPDIIRPLEDGSLETIEVKDYDLESDPDTLSETLAKQIRERKKNLPDN